MTTRDVYYFAYSSLLSPEVLSRVAPAASFLLTAHLPETKLLFRDTGARWQGAIPTVIAEEGNTVWGALFQVTKDELAAIDAEEAANGRVPTESFSAVDREGKRYWVVTHIVEVGPEAAPDLEYIQHMVTGGTHWHLPTGWVLNLEDYLEEDLLA
jgi:hypothetical protein